MSTIQIVNDADGCPAVIIDGTKVAELAHDQQITITVGATAGDVVASATEGDGD